MQRVCTQAVPTWTEVQLHDLQALLETVSRVDCFWKNTLCFTECICQCAYGTQDSALTQVRLLSRAFKVGPCLLANQ